MTQYFTYPIADVHRPAEEQPVSGSWLKTVSIEPWRGKMVG